MRKTRGLRKSSAIAALICLIVATGIFTLISEFQGLEGYEDFIGLPSASDRKASSRSKLRVTFLGVTSLLFDDGETIWMTDGFFSRPGRLNVLFANLAADEAVIARALERAHVKSLAAVIPIHSHYDHSLDSSIVSKKTGAKLIGSFSTANIGRGSGLPEEQIHTVTTGDVIHLGKFKITFIGSKHSPTVFYDGFIDQPFTPPRPATYYKTGDCYSLLVEHEGRSILIHGSAGFEEGALKSYKANVVFLGIGTLGMQNDEFREKYWTEVVKTVGARRVILVHWDNIFKSIDEPLVPQPWPIDRFKTSMNFLKEKGYRENVDIRLPVLWQRADPFIGMTSLPATTEQ